ncbi:MAG: RcnB family protein [Betaproteobacteria bacterium]|nr:RcnB family protein [Betaproteobacteria bacterium]
MIRARGLTLALAAIVAAGPAFADKPPWAGSGKKGEQGYNEERGSARNPEQRAERGGEARRGHEAWRFGDRRRIAIREYYAKQYRRGRCPPGLAKKHNGCMPPGQARKWAIGEPLPRDVVRYDLPRALVVELGPPPAGYRYVRVASDILLIAVGTGMVVDAINDLGR